MAKNKKTPFAIDKTNNVLCVMMKYSGIHPLCVFSGGLSIARFSKDKNSYLSVEDVLAWHKKEVLSFPEDYKDREIIEILTTILASFNSGNVLEAV